MEQLNEEKKHILEEFKSVVSDIKRPDQDDIYLLKWLKARNFHLKKAEKMYRKSMAWRDEIGADTLLDTFEVSDTMKRYYGGGMCGYDKEGRPVWIDPLGRTDMKGIMMSVKKSDILKTMIYRMETLNAEFRRRTEETGKQVHQCIQILDMEGFGLRIMWKPAFDLFIELLHLLDDNYPETLKRTYIINAPRLFHIGWKVMKTFLNEDTAKKFKFLDKDYPSKLLEIIDPDQLPAFYGGTKRDPDGNPKCETLVCYGGEVPRELYKNVSDMFPPGIERKQHVLARNGSLTVGFSIPDCRHVIQYVFSVDWGTLEFGVFASFDGDEGTSDVNKMEVVQPIRTIDCSRVPEDGLIFPEKQGYYCSYFRNTSRIYRKTLTYVMDVKVIEDQHIRDSGVTMETNTDELTQL